MRLPQSRIASDPVSWMPNPVSFALLLIEALRLAR